MALLGAFTVHRLRERPRILRVVVLLAIAVVFLIFAIAWYRFEGDLFPAPATSGSSSAYPTTCSRWRSAPGWQRRTMKREPT